MQVVTLSDDRIIDTNGAGDAFVGGFLAQLARGKSIKECVDCGIWAATEIIQQSGCTCPDKKYNAWFSNHHCLTCKMIFLQKMILIWKINGFDFT